MAAFFCIMFPVSRIMIIRIYTVPQSSYINRSIRSLHDASYSGISNSTPFQFDTFQLVPVTYFYPVKFKIRSQPDVSSRVNLKRQKKRPLTEQLKFILLRINSPKAITSSYIQPSIFKYRVINNMVWTLSRPLVMVQIMIKTVLLSAISAYSTSICAYIYLVIFFIITNRFYVIMVNRVLPGRRVISKDSTRPMQPIHTSPICANPQIMVFIFDHLPHNRKV